jgi:hypothetical protein
MIMEKESERKHVGIQGRMIIDLAAVTMVVLTFMIIGAASIVSANAVERSFDKEGGVLKYRGDLPTSANVEPVSISMYDGEEIFFENAETGRHVEIIVSGPYKGDGDKMSGCMDYHVKADGSWDSSGMKTGYFYYVVEKNDTGIGCWFGLEDHSFTLMLEKDEVQENAIFNLALKKNNKKEGVMKLTVEDKEGYSIMNGEGSDIYEVLVNYTERKFTSDPVDADNTPISGIQHDTEGVLVFNTSELEMKEGKYEIILEDYATEEDDDVDVEVKKLYLEVECDDEVLKGDDIIITIKSSFYEDKAHVCVGTFYNKTLTLDEEGKKKVRIPTEDVDYGRYKVTVEVNSMWDTEYVMIRKSKISLEAPENAVIGDIVRVKGTSESGEVAAFLIDNTFEGEAPIRDVAFEWNWDTHGSFEGYRGIEMFILRESAPFSVGDSVSEEWQRTEGLDASASIFLFPPTFSMSVSKSLAKDEPVVIHGTATGTDYVCIIAFDYKGHVVFPPNDNANEVNALRTPVENELWSETIGKLDSGKYAVIALCEGEDGRTKAITEGKWEIGGECKTLEQRVAILLDALNLPGSDDLYKLAYFTLAIPKVRLEVPHSVDRGDELLVKAETNIDEGAEALVTLSYDDRIIDKIVIAVRDGSVNTTIDTTGLQPGTYTVTVNIMGEATDEKDVIVVENKKGVVTEDKDGEDNESISLNESVAEAEVREDTVKVSNVDAVLETDGLKSGFTAAMEDAVQAPDNNEVKRAEGEEEKMKIEAGNVPLHQNESVPEHEVVLEAIEGASKSGNGTHKNQEEGLGGGEEQKAPIHGWEFLVAIVMATIFSIALKKHR